MNLFGLGLWCYQHRSFECVESAYILRDGVVYQPPRCVSIKWGPYEYEVVDGVKVPKDRSLFTVVH